MATDFNESVADLPSEDDFHDQRKAVVHKKNPELPRPSDSGLRLRPNNTNNPINRNNTSEHKKCANNKHKKSVRFDVDATLCGQSSAPRASDMSASQKDIRWYGVADFDRFKRDAAADAGVRIVRFSKKEPAVDSRHFAMAGDFDSQFDGETGTTAERTYYNENEYSDSQTKCMRGLGHHFSRARRRSRAAARSTVAAWQRLLLADADDRPAPRTRQNLSRAERARLNLALVSARCSRRARAEARWRGDVDYRVAYPERHAGAPPAGYDDGDPGGSAAGECAAACGKRPRDVGDGVENC